MHLRARPGRRAGALHLRRRGLHGDGDGDDPPPCRAGVRGRHGGLPGQGARASQRRRRRRAQRRRRRRRRRKQLRQGAEGEEEVAATSAGGAEGRGGGGRRGRLCFPWPVLRALRLPNYPRYVRGLRRRDARWHTFEECVCEFEFAFGSSISYFHSPYSIPFFGSVPTSSFPVPSVVL